MKNFVKKYKKQCTATFLVLMFLAGYFLMTLVLAKPSDEARMDYLEQVAYDVYEQRESFLVEVPDDVNVEADATSIVVRTRQWNERGNVVATLKGGELVFERNQDTGVRNFLGIMLGMAFFLVGILICIRLKEKEEKKKKLIRK